MVSPMQRVSSLVSKDIGNYLTNKQTWGSVIYNVKSYGAKGDGTTDDNTPLQSAFDAVPSNGGTVVLPPGTYFINTTTLKISSNTLVLAYGATIKVTKSIGKIITNEDTVNGNENIRIYGLTIDGPGNIGVETDAGIHLVKCTNSEIIGCNISDVRGDGITLGNITGGVTAPCDNVIVRGCVISNVYRQGIALTDAENCIVEDNTITSCKNGSAGTGTAIDLEPNFNGQMLQKNIVRNNHIYDCVGGIYLASVANVTNTLGNILDGNVIDTVSDYGIKIAYNYTTASNNKLLSVSKHGMYVGTGGVVQINGILIDGNTINDAGIGTNATYSGVRLENVVHSNITDNIIRKNSSTTNKVLYAFSEDSNSAQNSYKNNHARAVSVGYSVQSTSKVSHNHWDESQVNNVHEGFVSSGDILMNGNKVQLGTSPNTFNIYQTSGLPSSGTGSNNDIAFVVAPTLGTPVGYKKVGGSWYPFGQVRYLTSIGSTPDYVGQEALVGGLWYKAIATSSSADWKQITN